MTAVAHLLADGRLHLQHGPIDCLCRAWGTPQAIQTAYTGAATLFPTLLPELCAELPLLRTPLPAPRPHGAIAQAMHDAALPHATRFITPMAAVAGAVADHLLAAMTTPDIRRAFVNNGGDIAFHLAPGESLTAGLVTILAAPALDGLFRLAAHNPSRGLATSGRATKGQGGRSFSLGIADSVTVLAATAAIADAAATIIANDVDLPGHPAVTRRPATDLDPDSDLGARLVTWRVAALTAKETRAALAAGRHTADALIRMGTIHAAVLCLNGEIETSGLAASELT